MKVVSISALIALCFIMTGCVDHEDSCCGMQETNNLEGTWLLYEHGYSPGFGYITEEVLPNPAQTITFEERRISSTVNGWEKYKYYQILNDSIVKGTYIAFYEKDPRVFDSPSSKVPRYSFKLKDNTLTLSFRWCTEGCHEAFRKIDAPE